MILGFGVILAVLPFLYGVSGTARLVDVVAGVGVVATSAAYLASPTWRSYVVLDDRGLRVVSPRGEKLNLSFRDITEVIADDEERAALVRGPRTFLIPSPGHPAPYKIERADELYGRLIEKIPAEKVRHSRELS